MLFQSLFAPHISTPKSLRSALCPMTRLNPKTIRVTLEKPHCPCSGLGNPEAILCSITACSHTSLQLTDMFASKVFPGKGFDANALA